ncbi:branched-chain amino acid ABC transporter permease [Mangrovitalea sediminis]|uniref:branched-chain amino acid ABC transporter permease n=1 Tax=Mangrovitalea sediminis TaxID=1982043 RepID=UPI000BE559FA|nr:branched-chain amino acid ABC transporter permease [Mangrovitalea sediminis]
MLKKPFFWIMVATVIAFVVMPIFGGIGVRESLFLAAVYMILALNLNLMIGYTGYVNFGSIVFFGLGGTLGIYAITVMGWPLWAALIGAAVVVALLALLLGLGILRLRGAYFALATIGVVEATKSFVSNFDPFGGSTGMYISFSSYKPLGGPREALWIVYFLVIAVLAASLLLGYMIKRSRFGLGLFAIREDEDAAMVLGVKAPLFKAIIYSVSSILPAMAGVLFFFKNGVIQPDQAFELTLSIEAIVMLMLGGQGTVFGAALGGFAYEQFRGYLLTSATFSNFHLVIAGALLLLIVLFAPGGLTGWLHERWSLTRRVLE